MTFIQSVDFTSRTTYTHTRGGISSIASVHWNWELLEKERSIHILEIVKKYAEGNIQGLFFHMVDIQPGVQAACWPLTLIYIYPSIILRELVYDVKDILKAVCMNEPPNFIINSFSKKFIHHHVCKSYFKYEQDFPEPRRMN